MTADRLQTLLDEAVAANDAPFLIAMTADGEGVRWSGVAGDSVPGKPAAVDAVFRFYSMTKAVGCTAAMMLIDRGLIELDTPAATILPEIGRLQVLDGFDGDVPRLRAPRRPITIRHLATHTSGLAYDLLSADLQRYIDVTGQTSYFTGLRDGLNYPLLFDPGEGWAYGIGIDWLGLIVEQVSGRTTDRFCQDEIFDPLGMIDSCFELDEARAERLSRLYVRGEGGSFAEHNGRQVYTGRARDEYVDLKGDYYGMGGCLYGTAPDYLRLLRTHLNGGMLDGRRLISEALVRRLQANLAGAITVGWDFFPGTRKGHAFAFMRTEEDMPGMRAAGSLYWCGGANGHYWIDPKNDLVGLYLTHDAPFLDPRFMARYGEFERAVYASL
jgi:CubicO group peptidase (beta-lactamase class C family)